MRLSRSLPPLTIRNVFTICGLVATLTFMFVFLRTNIYETYFRFGSNEETQCSVSNTPLAVSTSSALLEYNFRVAAPGETIHIEGLSVEIATVVHNDEYPAEPGFQISINGWVRDRTPTDFKCCLLRSLPNGELVNDVLTEAKSETYHIYTQWIVDRQNAEFSCVVPSKQITAIGDANFSYVTFHKDSCLNASKVVLPILRPKTVPNSVCVCLKITYGDLNPVKMIEWFEYTRHMGVTKVFTYYAEVGPPALKVLQYYQSIGYLELLPIQPAVSEELDLSVMARRTAKHFRDHLSVFEVGYPLQKGYVARRLLVDGCSVLDVFEHIGKRTGGETRRFRHPRFNEQAWVDEVMAANDCKYRMAKYDFIIIMDIDEIILPKGNLTSYFDILQATTREMPETCAYSFDVHVVMLDWGATRSSPLNFCRFVTRTEKANYESFGTDTRWAFRPNMTYWARNNDVTCKDSGHPATSVPSDKFIALHYRQCKDVWTDCDVSPRVNDTSILKYELPLVDRILCLPLKDFVSDSDEYISSLVNWKKEITQSTGGNKPLK